MISAIEVETLPPRRQLEAEKFMGKQFNVLLASPRGFCAGVERAIEIVERALDLYGPPVYVRHEIVHNKHCLLYTSPSPRD